jgi:hypothetical protein
LGVPGLAEMAPYRAHAYWSKEVTVAVGGPPAGTRWDEVQTIIKEHPPPKAAGTDAGEVSGIADAAFYRRKRAQVSKLWEPPPRGANTGAGDQDEAALRKFMRLRLEANRLHHGMSLVSGLDPSKFSIRRHDRSSWMLTMALTYGGPNVTSHDVYANNIHVPVRTILAQAKSAMTARSNQSEEQLRRSLHSRHPTRPYVQTGEPTPDKGRLRGGMKRADVGALFAGNPDPRRARAAIDVTNRDVLAPCRVAAGASPTATLDGARNTKMNDYTPLYHNFTPLPMSLTGGISDKTNDDLNALFRRTTSYTAKGRRTPDWVICNAKKEILSDVAFAVIHLQAMIAQEVVRTRGPLAQGLPAKSTRTGRRAPRR